MKASTDDYIKDGWFMEKPTSMWPGQGMCLKVKQVLWDQQSEYQHVIVFESESYGNVLVLDGIIQVTERDEFAYQEMMTHVVLFAHPNPKKVLIIGGGDGGIAREVLKHKCIERIDFCELDSMVCDVSKKYLPGLSTGFSDPRVNLQHMDASLFIKDRRAEYDVIIVDSTDPIGPAESLFTLQFYEDLKTSLAPDGMICNQGECMWLHLDFIKQILSECGKSFSVVDWGYLTIPTYPSGQIGFTICGAGELSVRTPNREMCPKILSKCKYYTHEIHSAAFILPKFASEALASVRKIGKLVLRK
jgi:spermidine synthase